jgi:hypothetical protein
VLAEARSLEQGTREVGVRVDDLSDALAREGLLAEATLYVAEHLSVRGVRVVE